MAKLVLTAIGEDRPGLVSALSQAVAGAGGNWLESQMSRLAGTFAGIVLVDVAAGRVGDLRQGLGRLGAEGVLSVDLAEVHDAEAPAGEPLHVSVIGNDRPGIVREVSGALASLGVTIERLGTETREAPMADGRLFEADADVRVPSGVSLQQVQHAIEALAHDLVVDLDAPEPD